MMSAMNYITFALWICLLASGSALAENSMESHGNDTAETGDVRAEHTDTNTEPTTATLTNNATPELPAWIFPAYPPYVSKDKLDPFVSFIKAQEAQAPGIVKKERKPQTPLESVDINQLKLIGILKNSATSLAMVEMPDGKGYLIRPGTRVGLYEGMVTAIEQERLVIEENYVDVFGEAKKRTAYLRLRQEKE